jgi:hypothetical protein
MSIPSTIAEYLSCFSQELGDRILQIYPALQAPQDPVSERFKTLLRSPFAAQRLAVMGIVKRWHRAKAAAVAVILSKSWPNRPQLWFNIDLRPRNSVNSLRLDELSEFIPRPYHGP